MTGQPPRVFIAEDEDHVVVPGEERADRYLTGRFSGHLDTGGGTIAAEFADLSLDAALAWARERADRIVVHLGDAGPYVIGGKPGAGYLAWPEEGLPQPARRRAPDEAWKDRTDADPDATWAVTLYLAPPHGDAPDRAAWDPVADAAARALGASWSAKELNGFLADVRRAERSGREYVMTSHRRAYTVEIAVQAPTQARAVAAARERAPALPDGWELGVGAQFVGD